MSLSRKLLKRERKRAKQWLSAIDTSVYRMEDDAYCTDYTFTAKDGDKVSVSVLHTKPCADAPQDYRYYREARALYESGESNSIIVVLTAIFTTPAYKKYTK